MGGPEEPTLVGRMIGSYRVVAEIGRGGMGAVYRAEHPLIGRKVAIKVLLGELSKDADNIGRFFNEARAAAGIRHPALVDVFDFGYLPEGSAYLVMDFLEGETLGARIARGRMPSEVAVAVTRQLCSGMSVAHAKGIIHRDLKPENVFLMADDGASVPQVKILDFGIAKLTGEQGAVSASQRTRTGILMGTPLYMSPEQCRGAGTVDLRTDLYSLGCIVYAMLTGGPPFQREGAGELIASHLYEQPAPVRSREPSVSSDLDAIVLRLLAKRPEDRQQTMAELDRELERLAAGATTAKGIPRTAPIMPAQPAAPGGTAELPAVAATGAVDTARLRPRVAEALGSPEAQPNDTLDHGAIARTSPVVARRRLAPLLAIAGGAAVVVIVALVLRGSPQSGPEPVVTAPAPPPPAVAAAPAVPAVAAAPVAPPAPPKPAPVAPAADVETANPAATAAGAPPREEPPTAARREPQHERAGELVTIAVHNARSETTVRVDGHKASLPLKLPKDGKSHTLKFETPSFEPETVEIKASRDRAITLKNRPFLLMP